jgi:hypothetical protein
MALTSAPCASRTHSLQQLLRPAVLVAKPAPSSPFRLRVPTALANAIAAKVIQGPMAFVAFASSALTKLCLGRPCVSAAQPTVTPSQVAFSSSTALVRPAFRDKKAPDVSRVSQARTKTSTAQPPARYAYKANIVQQRPPPPRLHARTVLPTRAPVQGADCEPTVRATKATRARMAWNALRVSRGRTRT